MYGGINLQKVHVFLKELTFCITHLLWLYLLYFIGAAACLDLRLQYAPVHCDVRPRFLHNAGVMWNLA